MEPFLDRLAALLLRHHRHELDRVAVVLPGRRAGLHLRKYLARASGTVLWSPEVLDMGAFMQRLGGTTQGGSLEMLLLLYRTYCDLLGDRAEPFAEFLEWAPVALRDMSEVDSHLLDIDGLYRDLTEYHELEEWSFRLGEQSPGQQRLNRQWRSTGELHSAFRTVMQEGRVATSGHIARHCAGLLGGAMDLPWKMVWFAGLNALDPASTAVIKALQERGLARVAWDADTHYLTDPRQEAGRYLRRSMAALGSGELPPSAMIMEQERKVIIVAAPNAYAQTTYVAQRLAALSLEERAQTAVVLADENLLLPLLEQLPSDIGHVNVTMGMPLRMLPVHGLTEAFLDLLVNATPVGGYLLSGLEAVLGHPFLHEGEATSHLIAALREQQTVRVSTDVLMQCARESRSGHVTDMSSCLSLQGTGPTDLTARFNALFQWAKACAPRDAPVQEQLFQMARLQHRLDSTLKRSNGIDPDLRTYIAIRDKLVREEQLSFLGEPLRGLQVMGLLETRALDHQRLLLISANDGVLPPTSAQQSWIPFDLRRHHKLPMPADGEAIAAYHFNRVMHMAREVELVYNAGGDADGGEPSRFIAQWGHEVVGHGHTTMEHRTIGAASTLRPARALVVEKDAATMDRLKTICERGLSPSALGTWLRCPLDFHFRYVLGIREQDIADGTLGSDVLGDAVHHVLEELLKPIVGRQLSSEDVDDMIPRVNDLLLGHLMKRYARNTLDLGHFRLRREMAGTAIQRYLAAERERCRSSMTRVIAVEQEVRSELSNGVVLKGRCDRIDERDGLAMVLDVKTGAVRPEDLRLNDLTRGSIGPEQRYALQLLIYAWAYLKQQPQIATLGAGVIPLQRASQPGGDFLRVGSSTVLERHQLDSVDALLAALVDELLDPSIPVTHDPKSTYCSCCVG